MMSKCVIAHEKFYQAFPSISVASIMHLIYYMYQEHIRTGD